MDSEPSQAYNSNAGQNGVPVRRTGQKRAAKKDTESLDYHLIHNEVQKRRCQGVDRFTERSWLGVKPYTCVKLLVTIAIGLTVGVLAVGLAVGTETIITFKNATARQIIHDGRPLGVLRAALFHIAFSVVLVLIGSSMVQFWAPAAGGAGVSLIIAYLNGCAVPRLLNYKNLITKWVGTILGVSSNLALGPEAPMVHLGASVAHVYTHATCMLFTEWRRAYYWLLCCVTCKRPKDRDEAEETPVSIFANDADRREFICAGAAAGIAAAFGAPIGGVLFSMEEASTHWSRKVAWRCFLCTAVAVFTLAQLHPRWKHGILSFHGVAELSNEEWFTQLPFIVVVAVSGGLLGAAFNWMHERIFAIRANRFNNRKRILEVCIIVSITVASIFTLAYSLGSCVDVPEWKEKGYGFTFYCTDGRYNDLATAFLANPDDTIRHIFSLGNLSPKAEVCHGDNCYFTLRSLIILCPSYLIFMSLSAGIAIPGGLFMPSMLVGGSFGATCGLLLMKWLPSWNIQPGVYAMCAATAMLGGVFRASISLVVLLVEGTQSTKFMLGIIISVICSNWIGDWILSEGVYETDLERDGTVVFLRPSPPLPLYRKDVSDFMAWPVWCLRGVESVAYIRQVLTDTTHNGFPIVRGIGEAPIPALAPRASSSSADGEGVRGGPMEGLILRSQLLVLLESKAYCDKEGEPLDLEFARNRKRREAEMDKKMKLFHRSTSNYSHQRENILMAHVLDRAFSSNHHLPPAGGQQDGLTNGGQQASDVEEESRAMEEATRRPKEKDPEDLYVDLRPFMDRAPTTVRPETPGERAHVMFLSMGLRHLPVVDEASHVVGIITRKDLDYAAGFGPWRRNKQASQAFTLGLRVSASSRRLRNGLLAAVSALSSGSSPGSSPLNSSHNSPTEPLLEGSSHSRGGASTPGSDPARGDPATHEPSA